MEHHYSLAMHTDARAVKSMASYRALSAEFDAELAAHRAAITNQA